MHSATDHFTCFLDIERKDNLAKAAGLALGIGGAILLIMSKEKSGTSSITGDTFIILNAIATLFILSW
jgi:drug/metabolite transporter (DMT)-like permease